MISSPQSRAPIRTFLFLLIVAIWVIPSFRSVVHETDQTALLDGAWQLSHGRAPMVNPGLYNYDKLFVTYWILAAIFRVLQSLTAFDPVAVGNVVSSLLFSTGLICAVWRATRSRRVGSMLFAAALAPALLLHAPYLAAVFFSGGFLLLLFRSLAGAGRRSSVGKLLVIAGLTFSAVGSRADAVLVLPLVCWLTLWPLRRPWRMLWKRSFWAASAGAAAALVVGKLIGPHDVVYALPPVFNAKVFAAYTVFGLGASGVVLVFLFAGIGLAAIRTRSWRRLSWALGALWLALPFAFYLIQLCSTRYWVPGLVAILTFLSARRGRALGASIRRSHPSLYRLTAVASLALAIIPLAVGISLPFPTRPRLVLSQSTRFPSADGFLPMGAYAAFLFRSSGDGDYIPDHNQAIWLAAKEASFEPNERGNVAIMPSAMLEILVFACHFRGYSVDTNDFELRQRPFYVDLRSLVKLAGGLDTEMHMIDQGADVLRDARLEEISPRFRGTSLLKVTPLSKPDPTANARLRAFRAIYRGDDFQLYEAKRLTEPGFRLNVPLREGRTIAIADRKPFELIATGRDGGKRTLRSWVGPETYGLSMLVLDGHDADLAELYAEGALSANAEIAQASLPDYMSVRLFAR